MRPFFFENTVISSVIGPVHDLQYQSHVRGDSLSRSGDPKGRDENLLGIRGRYTSKRVLYSFYGSTENKEIQSNWAVLFYNQWRERQVSYWNWRVSNFDRRASIVSRIVTMLSIEQTSESVSSITSRIHYYLYLHRLFVSRRILAEMTEANVYQQTVSWKSYPGQNWPGQKQKEYITRRRATWNPSGVSVVVPWKWLYVKRIVEVRRKGEKGKEEDSLTLGRQEEDRMTEVTSTGRRLEEEEEARIKERKRRVVGVEEREGNPVIYSESSSALAGYAR